MERERQNSRPWRRATTLAATFVLGLAAAAGPAAGDNDGRTFPATAVRIVNLIGTLEIDVVRTAAGTHTTIGGPDEMISDVGLSLEGQTLVVSRKGMVEHTPGPFDAARYPTVRIEVSPGTPVTIDGMDGVARIGDISAPLTAYIAALDLHAGAVSAARIDRSGSGRIEIGTVTGPFVADLGGSGDLIVGTTGTVELRKRGSGDISFDRILGPLVAQVRGSGDIRVQSATAIDIEKHGSGDITLGRIAGGVTYQSTGIGDVEIGAVDGPVNVETTSRGAVRIREGRAEPLRVVMREYGEFTLDGQARDPDLTVEGASIVRIRSYVGELSARGTGFFDVKRLPTEPPEDRG